MKILLATEALFPVETGCLGTPVPTLARSRSTLARHDPVTIVRAVRWYLSEPMSPELPESDIRRIVRQRLREGTLLAATRTVPAAAAASGSNVCLVCGFAIRAGRNECAIDGARAHEGCAVMWREESDRAL